MYISFVVQLKILNLYKNVAYVLVNNQLYVIKGALTCDFRITTGHQPMDICEVVLRTGAWVVICWIALWDCFDVNTRFSQQKKRQPPQTVS